MDAPFATRINSLTSLPQTVTGIEWHKKESRGTRPVRVVRRRQRVVPRTHNTKISQSAVGRGVLLCCRLHGLRCLVCAPCF